VTDQTYAEMRTVEPTRTVRWNVDYTDISWGRTRANAAMRCDSSR
jgi:hypothetical protein